MVPSPDLQGQCDLLRSLHRPGTPLLLPNVWDVATAKAVVAAGFPVVATTSGGVAATLGYEDQEGAPADEMLAAAARIVRGVDVPVTVDAEAGYGTRWPGSPNSSPCSRSERRPLGGHGGVLRGRERPAELPARADTELGKHLVQVARRSGSTRASVASASARWTSRRSGAVAAW